VETIQMIEELQGLRQLLFGDLAQEISGTRRVLERLPEGGLDWAPHERSMTLGKLATHVATLPFWPMSMLREDFFDLTTLTQLNPMRSRGEILEQFDRIAGALQETLSAMPEGDLLLPWQLRRGEEVILETTRAAAVRSLGLSHLIHHRGQLTVYLRLLDIPLPPLYGPTADESI